MKKDIKQNNTIIGIVYYTILIILDISIMLYYHFYDYTFANVIKDYPKRMSFFEKGSLAFMIATIVGIVLCFISLLLMLIKRKQHAFGLSLPMLFLATEEGILIILARIYLNTLSSYRFPLIILALFSTVFVFVAQAINNKPLKIIGVISVVLLIAYVIIFKISFSVQCLIDNWIFDYYYLSCIYYFIYIICFVLVVVQIFPEKTTTNQRKVIPTSINNNNKTKPIEGTADKLLKYKELLDVGAISQEEFNAKKKELMDL